jgi:hypothetical protein
MFIAFSCYSPVSRLMTSGCFVVQLFSLFRPKTTLYMLPAGFAAVGKAQSLTGRTSDVNSIAVVRQP